MLEKVIGSNYFKFFFFGLCFAILFSKSDRVFGWTNVDAKSSEPVMSDGSGYYAHLPQWFTYHTSGFEFTGKITKKYPKSRFTDFTGNDTTTGKYYNKYYVGSAVCLVPFYWIAQTHAAIVKVPNDGYSWPFLFWTNIGVIFFSIFGGIGLFRLAQFYKIKPWITYFGIAGVLFGTNLCYYTTVEIPFSHVFCFTINTWILVFAKKWSETNKRKHFYWFSALIGLAIIIRPTNAFVIVAIPFLFKSTSSFVARLKELVLEKKLQLLIGLLLASAFIAFQLWNVWKITGLIRFNSYSTETFDNWKNPELWNVLFSWKKGLFVYTPLMILLFPAMIVCYRKERRVFWGVIVIFSMITYMTASWWMWWFGGGLGARNYIDFMALFGLAIMILIQNIHWILKLIVCGLAVWCTWVYGIYDYQMRHAILSCDKMTASTFADVFLQTDTRFAWYPDRIFDKQPTSYQEIGESHLFSDINNKVIENRIIESDKSNLADNPKLNVSLKESKMPAGKSRFGVEYNVDIRVYEQFNNPSVSVCLFQKDSLIEERSIQFGGKIPSLKDWHQVKLFFNMKTRCSEVDSVQIITFDGLGNMGVRNAKAQFYSYK